MKLDRLFRMLRFSSAVACWLAAFANPQGQTASSPPEAGVVLTKLSTPVYPPLARQAHITGDVKVQVSIRKDGSVVAAYVVSGHAMLMQPVLASALRSTFECRGCSDPVTTYSLTYTFGLREDIDCGVKRLRSAKCLYLWACGKWRDMPPHAPAIAQSQDHITIIVDSACVETDVKTVQRDSGYPLPTPES